MIRTIEIVLVSVAGVFWYVGVANGLYLVYERRGECERCAGGEVSTEGARAIAKSALWPVTLALLFLFVLPRVIVLAIETRWRDRKAVKAETPEAKVYR